MATATATGAGGQKSKRKLSGIWQLDVLTLLGAPATPANLRFLNSWWLAEGGDVANTARFNWLNTTRDASLSSGSINKVGVRTFPSYQNGIVATVESINALAPNLIAGLRTGDVRNGNQSSIMSELQTWVGGTPGYAAKVLGGSGQIPSSWISAQQKEHRAATGGGGGFFGSVWSLLKDVSVFGPTSGGQRAGLPGPLKEANTAVQAAGSGLNALGWAADPKHWARIGYVLGGGILVLGGLLLLARSIGAANVNAPQPITVNLPGSAPRRRARESELLDRGRRDEAEERAAERDAKKTARSKAKSGEREYERARAGGDDEIPF